jgi:hypothetical protein
MMEVKISDGMLDAAMATYASLAEVGADAPGRAVMRAALTAALAHPDASHGEDAEWYLFQAWSARIEDGKLVPGEPISGSGIHFEVVSGKTGYLEMQRTMLEDIGRIEKGAPYFCIEAPFRLMKRDDE